MPSPARVMSAFLLPALLLPASTPGQEPGEPAYAPKVAPASEEAERAIPGFALPEDFRIELVAAEPLLANPVCFTQDARGRIYVAETFRQEFHGVPDNRGHTYWIPDDLKSRTVEDRRAMYLKHHPEVAEEWTREHERIRLLEDLDGDGRMDRSTVFADGFHDLLDGTGAGLLVRQGRVYYTCIPHLWLLEDRDGDGRADERRALSSGYGVRVALRGHDLHGLVLGPDGRIYFSIGDRGYHVETPDGRLLHDPGRGAVFRCLPDGSDLEIYATGLRNPQELAFDDHGNLWTGDNNSDAGDRARLTWILEGGEHGWRMNFQYLPDRGPWMPEGWWHTWSAEQAAFLVPPIAHVGSGPSGLTVEPGLGFPEEYRGALFLCDFRGGPRSSGVLALQVRPRGAGFELVRSEPFLQNLLATDAEFGPDGRLYVSDWVEGWTGVGKGRIYRVEHPASRKDPRLEEAQDLLARGLERLPPTRLVDLLDHPFRPLRLEAGLQLASAGARSIGRLREAAGEAETPLGRLHAIWSLGILAREHRRARQALLPFLADAEAEVRAQTARVLGDCRATEAAPSLRRLLRDPEPRVRLFSAIALGRIGDGESEGPLLDLARENGGRDPFLRHAVVMGLTGCADAGGWIGRTAGDSREVRIVAVLVLRRWRDPRLAFFLEDEDPFVAAEAARAIYDLPVREALPALARRLGEREKASDPLLRRAIGAADLMGDAEAAELLADCAADVSAPARWRREALEILAAWESPSEFDRVLNTWVPWRPSRSREDAVRALEPRIEGLLEEEGLGEEVLTAAIGALASLDLGSAGARIAEIAQDAGTASRVRIAALRALLDLDDPSVGAALSTALASSEAELRAEAVRLLPRVAPEQALEVLERALREGTLPERQAAVRVLAGIGRQEADTLLAAWLESLPPGGLPRGLVLELLEARERRREALGSDPSFVGPLARHLVEAAPGPWDFALEGGDPERGRRVFFEKQETECLRCHVVPGRQSDGGPAMGPDLRGIASRRSPGEILRSIVDPNAEIAEGFEQVTLVTHGERVFVGRILEETPDRILLLAPEGQGEVVVELDPADIAERAAASSAMPENMNELLSREELRDLLAWLLTLKDESPAGD